MSLCVVCSEGVSRWCQRVGCRLVLWDLWLLLPGAVFQFPTALRRWRLGGLRTANFCSKYALGIGFLRYPAYFPTQASPAPSFGDAVSFTERRCHLREAAFNSCRLAPTVCCSSPGTGVDSRRPVQLHRPGEGVGAALSSSTCVVGAGRLEIVTDYGWDGKVIRRGLHLWGLSFLSANFEQFSGFEVESWHRG